VIGVIAEFRLESLGGESGIGNQHAGPGHQSEREGLHHAAHVAIESAGIRPCEEKLETFVGMHDRHWLAVSIE